MRATEPAISNAIVDSAAVAARTFSAQSGSAALNVAVAPKRSCRRQLVGVEVDRDDVLRLEHARREQRRQADATEPDHGDAAPCGIAAVLMTAPTPVITAQPKSAASANGRSRSTRTSERRESVANSAKPDTPRW